MGLETSPIFEITIDDSTRKPSLRSFSPKKIFAQFILGVGKHRIAFDFTPAVTIAKTIA